MNSINNFINSITVRLNKPNLKRKTNFFRLLSVSQKAGLGIREALISIKRSETHKWLLYIIGDLLDQVNQWISLAKAMKRHQYVFGIDEIALIKSAEAMGNMPEVLEQVSIELENTDEIKQKIKKAMTYPSVLIVFTILAVIALLVYVIPTIVSMFAQTSDLPKITQVMLWASDFFKTKWVLVIIWVAGLIFLYKSLYKFVLPFKMFIDKTLLTIPVVREVTMTFYMYRFSKLLWQFYTAGVSPVDSLDMMSEIFLNFHYKKKAIDVKQDLTAWFTFAESMEWSKLFDPILVQIIHVWEDTGDMWWVLTRISEYYRNILKNKIDILMSMLEPLLMAFVAIVIGIVVASIFIPMADMVNQI